MYDELQRIFLNSKLVSFSVDNKIINSNWHKNASRNGIMNNVTKLSDVQLHLLQQTPVKRYVLDIDDMKQFSNVVIKSNAIVQMELYGQDEHRLHGLDVQVLSTCFLMAQCLKQQRAIFDSNTVFEIPLDKFCELWQIGFTTKEKQNGNIYRDVSESASRLNQRNFVYPDVAGSKMVESGYFSYIKYDKSVVQFGFPAPILEYVNLDKQYTWYFLENIIKLREVSEAYKIAQYAIILYENIQKLKFKSRFTSNKVSVLELSSVDLRKLLGIEPTSYKRHIDFRIKLLDKIVAFIHERVKMRIEIENLTMGGRGVNGYRFTAYMTDSDLDFIAAINRAKEPPIMTVSQRMKFAPGLMAHTTFDAMYRMKGEKNPEFLRRIEKELADNDRVVEFEPYLRAVGFKSKKFDTYIAKLDDEVKRKIQERQAEKSESVGKQADLDLDGDEQDPTLPF